MSNDEHKKPNWQLIEFLAEDHPIETNNKETRELKELCKRLLELRQKEMEKRVREMRKRKGDKNS